MSRAKCIMVQGTMSGAGKSLLCTALCRIFAQDGYRVAPFKSQNMALNSFVTRDGLEMGRAQVVQAQAAGMEPDVRMNPILLKPSSDVGSQVIVNGEVRGQMPAAAYFKLKKSLIPDILAAYNSLAEEVDIIVIEGAGSPAEINLKADDIVNMGLAKLVDAPVLLAGDIDRGGVFAQLYGTVELSDDQIRKYAGKFAPLIRPELTCFVMDENDDLVAFGVAAPSIAAALKKHDGRLFPTGWADVLKAFHRNDTIDLLLIAVRPDLQKKGVNAVIISKVMHGCFKIGVKQAETGPMLETNEKVQSQWQDFPLEQHKRRRCFVKVLTPAPQESAAAATAPVGAAE